MDANTNTHPQKTLRDLALAAIPADLRETLLVWAGNHQINAPDDPFWTLAITMLNGLAVARASGEASEQILAAIGQIEDRVLKGATAAGQDTAGVIRIESAQVTDALKAAVGEAAKSAAARLARAAAAQGPEIVNGWKRELAAAAWDFSRRSQWRNLASLLTLIALGAVVGSIVTLYMMRG